MKRPWASAPAASAGRLLRRTLLLVAVVLATLPAAPLRAEGSRESALGGGYRAYLEYRQELMQSQFTAVTATFQNLARLLELETQRREVNRQ